MEVTRTMAGGAFRAVSVWAAPCPMNGARPFLRRQDSYGRGKTPQEAEISCIGEALERYSLIFRGNERLTRAKEAAINAINPNSIQLFSDLQFRDRRIWNAGAAEEFEVPEPYDPDNSIDWLEARDVATGEMKFVPAACCLMWYAFQHGEPEYAKADTVGCGAGPTFEHALNHALLEATERDAMAIWWDNRATRPGVRLESFEDSDIELVATELNRIGRDLFLLDCTTDIQIPSIMAVAPRFDGTEPLFAGAADVSFRAAAYKAASEVGQVWWEATRTGNLPRTLRNWLTQENCDSQPYLRPASYIDAPAEIHIPPSDRSERILASLGSAGLSAYAVDLTRTDVGAHVVRAIVPGLRHIWNRRAPGRLYDVPVKMGWRTTRNAEENLNPIRCMI